MRDFSVMPYEPAKLTTSDFTGVVCDQNMTETSQVVQTYIDCGWPGPSRFVFVDNVFLDWWPSTTYERTLAEHVPPPEGDGDNRRSDCVD